MTDPDLIRAAITAGGLSSRQFAVAVLGRDERTIRRWVSGEIEIPAVAREWLERWVTLSAAQRRRVVAALTG